MFLVSRSLKKSKARLAPNVYESTMPNVRGVAKLPGFLNHVGTVHQTPERCKINHEAMPWRHNKTFQTQHGLSKIRPRHLSLVK